MADGKGMTLIELIVVLIIVGIVALITIPSIVTSIEKSKAETAQANLLAISAAEQKYYEDQTPNAYCIALCDNKVDINGNLRLGIPASDPFTYSCAAGTPYLCTATDGRVTLTTSGSDVICTVGGGYCPTPT